MVGKRLIITRLLAGNYRRSEPASAQARAPGCKQLSKMVTWCEVKLTSSGRWRSSKPAEGSPGVLI